MSLPDDDNKRLDDRPAYRKRSSILKTAKSPNRSALKDLDLNFHSEEKKSVRCVRRVSFADKYQIKEFHTDSITFSSNTTELKPITGSDESSSASSSESTNFKSQIQGLDSLLCGKIENEAEVFQDEDFFPVENTAEVISTRQKRVLVVQTTQTSHKRLRYNDETDKDNVFIAPADHSQPRRRLSIGKNNSAAVENEVCDSSVDMSFTNAIGVINEKISSDFILSTLLNKETSTRETRKMVDKPAENETKTENDYTAKLVHEHTTETLRRTLTGNSGGFSVVNDKCESLVDMSFTKACGVINEVGKISSNFILSSLLNENETSTRETKPVKKSVENDINKENDCTANMAGEDTTEISQNSEKITQSYNDDVGMEMTDCLTGNIIVNPDMSSCVEERNNKATVMSPPNKTSGENEERQDGMKIGDTPGTNESSMFDDMDMTEITSGYIEINSSPSNTQSGNKGKRNSVHIQAKVDTYNVTRRSAAFDDMDMTDVSTGYIEVNSLPTKIDNEKEGEKNSAQIHVKIGNVDGARQRTSVEDMEMTDVSTRYIEVNSSLNNTKSKSEDKQNSEHILTKVDSSDGVRRSITFENMDMTEVTTGYIDVNLLLNNTKSENEDKQNSDRILTKADNRGGVSSTESELIEVSRSNIETQKEVENELKNNTSKFCEDEMEKTDAAQEDISENFSLYKSRSASFTQNTSNLSLTYEFTGQITHESTAQLLRETERALNQVDESKKESKLKSLNVTIEEKSETSEFHEKNIKKFPTTDELMNKILSKLDNECDKQEKEIIIEPCTKSLSIGLLEKKIEEKTIENSYQLKSIDVQEEMICDEQCPSLNETPSFIDSTTDLLSGKIKPNGPPPNVNNSLVKSVEMFYHEKKSVSSIKSVPPTHPAFQEFKMPVINPKKKTLNENLAVSVSCTPFQNLPSAIKQDKTLITPRQKTNNLQTNSLLKNVRYSSQKRSRSNMTKTNEKSLLGYDVVMSEVCEVDGNNIHERPDMNGVKQALKFMEETETDPLEKLNSRAHKMEELIDSKEEEIESDDIGIEDLFSYVQAADSMLESLNKADALLDEMLEKFSVVEDLERLENLNMKIDEKEQQLNQKNAEVDAEITSLIVLQQEFSKVESEIEGMKKMKEQEETNLDKLETKAYELKDQAITIWKCLEGHPEDFDGNGVCLSYLWRSLSLEVIYGEPIPAPTCFSTLPAFNITSIKLIPRIDPPNPLARLTHWLVFEGLKDNNFLEMSHNTFELYKVLNAVSTVAGFTRWLVEDVKRIETNHKITIEHNKITIKFVGVRVKAIFDLSFTILPNSYPLQPLQADFLPFIGDVKEESILPIIASVQPGAHYLRKIVDAVDSYLVSEA